MVTRFGVTIEQMGKVLAEEHQPIQDLTLDIAYHLAFAWLSLSQLKEAGVDLQEGRRLLIEDCLKRAWRELLSVRSRVPPEQIDDSLLSRYGRIRKR